MLTHNESALATAWFRHPSGNVQRSTLQQGRRRLPAVMPAGAMLMMRRDVLQAIGQYRTNAQGTEDWDLLCRLSERGYWGVTIPEVLFWDTNSAINQQRADQCSPSREIVEENQHLRFADIVAPLPAANLLKPAHASILLVLPFLDLGGADAWNLNVVKLLSRRGWRITPWDHPWRSRFLYFTADLWDAPQWIPHHWQGAWLAYLIESRAIDVVMISNTFAGYNLLPYLRHHAPRPVYVDYCHSATGKWYHGGYPHASARYSKFLDRSIFAANNVRTAMLSHGGDASRTGVVYAGVNATFYARNEASRARVRRVLGLHDNTVLIVYIGRLTLEKGPDTLGTILERLDKESLTESLAYFVLVVGSGDYESKLRKRVEALKPGRIRLVGSRTPTQVARYLSAADIMLLPSRFEGIALAIYEAMAAGVVPVASDVGGQSELVTEDAGILLPVYPEESRRVTAFTEALVGLIRDGQKLTRMKEAARGRIAAAFSLEWMETKLRKELCLAEANRRSGPLVYDDTWAMLAAHLNHLEQQDQVEWKKAESKEKKLYMELMYRLPPS